MEIKLNREEIANPDEIPLLDDLECTIDMMISLSPYSCRKCENLFCQECVKSWTKKSVVCPMRCSPFKYGPLENSILTTQINKIRLFCTNKSNGCKETCTIRDKEEHEKGCEYAPIECGQCKRYVCRKILNEHYFKACEKMKIKCYLCQESFSLFHFLSLHLEKCFKQAQYCEFCFRRVIISSKNLNSNALNEHVSNCECRVDICKKCHMPELSSKIENSHSHKHDSNNNISDNSEEMMSNYFQLI